MVRSGAVPAARLDEAVRRILRIKFALGLFDRPYVDVAAADPAVPAQRLAIARRAAEESFVLLENRKVNGAPLLPLSAAKAHEIALIGPLANSAVDMLGSWPGASDAENAVTLKTALADRADQAGLSFAYELGTMISGSSEEGFAKAIETAQECRRCRAGPRRKRARLRRGFRPGLARSAGKPGEAARGRRGHGQTRRPGRVQRAAAGHNWASGHVPAILEAWFPGYQAGPALARTLFGDVDPAGRLTVSVPRSIGQVPIYYNTLNTGRPRVDPIGLGSQKPDPYYITGYIDEKNTPLYPFGYGLTYTKFSYSDVHVDASTISARALNEGTAHLTVSADIKNTGDRGGTDVAQLYIRLRGTSVARPVRELKGFKRQFLAAGEKRTSNSHLAAMSSRSGTST